MSFHQFATRLLTNPEFQSALVRLSIWLFALVYIGLGAVVEYYPVELVYFYWLFGVFLLLFFTLLVSIFFYPVLPVRRYISLVLDIAATTLCILLTQEVVSPFYLLYIWIFISYGTRYGVQFLKAASSLSVLAYLTVLTVLGEWERYTFEVIFFLLLLVLLPLYQYALLRKLHQARLDAERSDRAKSIFLSGMTHELRTPIAGIIGMVELLRASPLDTRQQQFADSIASSSRLLDALVGDVLDLSSIESGGIRLKPQNSNIRQLVADVSSIVVGQCAEKSLELICRIDPQLPLLVELDELRLRQILLNLLGNAIKFTDQGEVRLNVGTRNDATGRWLSLEVADSGIGMDPLEQEKVFQRFWQADNSMATRHGGTGLGMTITRALVDLMGGMISLDSQPGRGSCFEILLPLKGAVCPGAQASDEWRGAGVLLLEKSAQARAAAVECCEQLGMQCHAVERISDLSDEVQTLAESGALKLAIIGDCAAAGNLLQSAEMLRQYVQTELPLLLLGYEGRGCSAQLPNSLFLPKPLMRDQLERGLRALLQPATTRRSTAGQGRLASQPRVLVAEDDAINAKVLSVLLEGLGCSVSWARDGMQALEMATRSPFDIAFVDLRMPLMDGPGFARAYRQLESEHQYLPIIALSANTDAATRDQSISYGMDDFLVKPVDQLQLQQVIVEYAGQSAVVSGFLLPAD